MSRVIAIACAMGMLLICSDGAVAQVIMPEWSEPAELSSVDGIPTRGAALLTDEQGFVHAFWAERSAKDQRYLIQHAIFNGQVWTEPVDIFTSPLGRAVLALSPRRTPDGRLLISWLSGINSSVYLMDIPIEKALLRSARHWSDVRSIEAEAYRAALRVSADGAYHLVYATSFGVEPGVYYTHSVDPERTWSDPVRLDRPPVDTYRAQAVSLKLDADGGFHVLWWYFDAADSSVRGRQIDYVHSLDGGESWSEPFTVDEESEDGRHQVRAAAPKLAVTGSNVEVVWAAGDQPYRHRRLSTDRGRAWAERERLAAFGTLHGQAGDALIGDEKGRLHYITQIRYPRGVYHTVSEDNFWGGPAMFYRIGDIVGSEYAAIHVHAISAAIAGGNKLVITFTNSPGEGERVLYSMHRVLDDLPALPTDEITLPAPEPADSSNRTFLPFHMG